MLTRIMNDSLQDLFSFWLLTKKIASASQPLSILHSEQHPCTVSLYIEYLLAGETAIRKVIKAIAPELRLSEAEMSEHETELLFSFRVLHHKEVNEFCEHCVLYKISLPQFPTESRPKVCLRQFQNSFGVVVD